MNFREENICEVRETLRDGKLIAVTVETWDTWEGIHATFGNFDRDGHALVYDRRKLPNGVKRYMKRCYKTRIVVWQETKDFNGVPTTYVEYQYGGRRTW